MSRLKYLLPFGGLALLRLWDPAWRIPLCALQALSGLPCPLCGLTRACALLVRGHWSAAIAFHPLSPLVLSLLVVSFWLPHRVRNPAWKTMLVLLAFFGAARIASQLAR